MQQLIWKRISTLARKNNNILYCCVQNEILVQWSKMNFSFTEDMLYTILQEFFSDGAEKVMGASMTDPPKDGFGWYLYNRFPHYSPRHASVIAAIMYDLGLLDYRVKKAVYLRKK
ncbi:MAG TPA: hypothetical protein H9832_11225 [Candidatus Agathobaculum merdavium]|nr:hypothetical protein [Candidatus Agathobaculum merdavium]